jgi:phage baseplate assembly protein W
MAELVFENVREYKDISLTWAQNPVTHDIQALTGAQAVIRAIKVLLSTHAGEVPFYPNFASNLKRLLFEPIDAITTSMIETEIKAVIDAYEPRAKVRQVIAIPKEEDNEYRIDLEIEILSTAQAVTFSVFLKRIR